LYLSEPAPGRALRYLRRLWHDLPQGEAGSGAASRRSFGTGLDPDRDLLQQPNLGGTARQVDPGQYPGRAAAAAAAECADPERGQERQEPDHPPTDGAASR